MTSTTPPPPDPQPMPTADRPSDPTPPVPSPLYSKAALLAWVKAAYATFNKMNGSLWSASFAYYAFFALFPMIVLSVTIAAGFIKPDDILTFMFKYVPLSGDQAGSIRQTIDGVIKARGGIGFVSLLGLLWSALGFFQALVGATNAAWGMEQPNWWRLPVKNLMMLGVLLSALLLGVLAPMISKTVQSYLAFSHWLIPLVLGAANLLVPTLVLFYGFLLFYKLAPRQRAGATFALVWLPALLVAALLQVAQQAFVIYTTNFAKFNAIYGTLGGIIGLMLWIYLSGMIIVFGGCLCATRRAV